MHATQPPAFADGATPHRPDKARTRVFARHHYRESCE
jgi:hypothetical protein